MRNLKNFHEANVHIQKLLDARDVVRLAADSLNKIHRAVENISGMVQKLFDDIDGCSDLTEKVFQQISQFKSMENVGEDLCS